MTSIDASRLLQPVQTNVGPGRFLQWTIDTAALAVCYGMAFLLKTHFYPSPEVQRWIWTTMPVVVGLKTVIFTLAGASLFPNGAKAASDMRRISLATAISALAVYLVNLTVFSALLHRIPRTVIVADGILALGTFALPRLWERLSTGSAAINLQPLDSQPPTPRQRTFAWAMILAAGAVGIAFPVRLCLELSKVGENTLGYDFVYYIEHFDKMFSGDYNWLDFPFDSFVSGGSHCLIVPRLLRIPIVLLTDWNHHVEIALGVFFAAAKVLLLVSLLGTGWNLLGKASLFALVSGLTFTLGHFQSFQFGPAAMNQQLSDAFFLGGGWFLVKQSKGWLAGMLVCGLCASLSYGSGLFCWPTYLLGMLLLGVRSWPKYLGWFLTAGLSASPYVLYRVLDIGLKREMSHNLFPFHLWAQSMTLPFFTMAEMTKSIRVWTLIGFTSVVFGFVFVTFAYCRYWKTDRKQLAPATMILLFPLWTMWLISFGRNQIAGWYSVHYAFVWTGIIGFAFLLGRSVRYSPLAASAFYRPRGFEWMSLTAAIVMGAFLIPGNQTAEGKDVFLTSRAPVAMSALREFRTAPTGYAFYPYRIWRVNYDFYLKYALMLEKHGWSVFGKRRLYLLQGDFGLDKVTLREDPEAHPIIWTGHRSPKPVDYTTYKRLNLLVYPPNALTWEVDLPAEISQATFQTAVAKVPKAKRLATCRVTLETGSAPPLVVWTSGKENAEGDWQTCEIPLRAYAGQTIRLTLESQGETAEAGSAWKAPQIQMELAQIPQPGETIAPSNATPAKFPAQSELDYSLEMNQGVWACPAELVKPTGTNPLRWSVTSGASWIAFYKPFALRAQDYSHFYVQCSLSRADRQFHNLSIVFRVEQNGREHIKEAIIPLLGTDELQEYCVDLRKLEIFPNAKITNITFAPAAADPGGLIRQFQLAKARFIRKPATKNEASARWLWNKGPGFFFHEWADFGIQLFGFRQSLRHGQAFFYAGPFMADFREPGIVEKGRAFGHELQ